MQTAEFIYCSVDNNGHVSDGDALNHNFMKGLSTKTWKFQGLLNVQNQIGFLSILFVGDKPFVKWPEVIKPSNQIRLQRNREFLSTTYQGHDV